jgi:hypothetical protein
MEVLGFLIVDFIVKNKEKPLFVKFVKRFGKG